MLAMKHIRPFLPLGAAFLLTAATYDPSLFSSMQWRSIGPQRGGRSITSAGSSARPLEYYFGATGGGLWKTTDGGLTWRPVTDGQIQSSSVGAVAVSESNPDVVYIGMGETELRGNIMQGDGVYKSTDAGKTWKHIGLENTQAISRIRIHPTNPDIVYVSALGHPYGAESRNAASSAPRTAAQTWEKVLYTRRSRGRRRSLPRPAQPQRAFRRHLGRLSHAVESFERRPAQRPLQVHRWRRPLDRDHAQSRSALGHRSARSASRSPARIRQSRLRHRGKRERRRLTSPTTPAPPGSESAKIATCASAPSTTRASTPTPKPKTPSTCSTWASTKSTDGGKTYRSLRPPHGDNHDLWIDPANPLRMIESNDGGGTVSVNGGQTWTEPGVRHRAALSRGRDQGHSVPRLRRPAG